MTSQGGKLRSVPTRVWLCVLGLFLVCLGTLHGAQVRHVSLAVGEAEVLEVRGVVERIRSNQNVSVNGGLFQGAVVTAGDRLRAAAGGYALLGLVDGSSIELLPNTELEILDFKGGVRELFRIWLGKVRIKIRKLVGAPNPYQMQSPIATIGVRGTEFEINVRQDSVTTVRVFEGLVSVRSNQVKAREVLVGPGHEVTVYPLRPPDPPVTFEQVVAENFSRESTVEHPLLDRFSAFPDPHLDLVENPAYASMIVRPSGRFYLFPARSQSFTSPEVSLFSPLGRFLDLNELFATDERRLQGVSSRASYVYPMDRWTLGGMYEYRGFDQNFDFQISRQLPSAFGGEIDVQQVGSSPFAPNIKSSNHSHRGFVLAARKWPGRTLAVSLDWTHQGGDISSLYEFRPAGLLLSSEQAHTLYTTDQQRVTVGYHMDNDNLGSLGLTYRFGRIDGSTLQDTHLLNQQAAPLAELSSSGFSQETAAHWRKRFSPGLYFSLHGSLTRTGIDEAVFNFRTADSNRQVRYWIPSVSSGLGYIWRERLFASLDYKFSSLRESSRRWDLFDGALVDVERGVRSNHGVSLWLQYHELPWGFFVGSGMTSFWASETLRGQYQIDSTGLRLDAQGRERDPFTSDYEHLHLNQLGFSIGKRFRNRLFLEYELTQTRGPAFRPLGHSFLLRFAF